jgi:Zn-dependent protease with chaperone function
MRRLVLQVILKLGRYAVLPVVGVAGALMLAWLMLLDRYAIAALVTAPILFSVVTAAFALALGILLLPSLKDRDFSADETCAPGLWAIWKELDRGFARPRRTLTINDKFNASIMEQSRYAGLFAQHVTMTVGLPLLILLDERAIRAIVAHEIAHMRLRHTSGGANLYDFVAASENVLYYADPERTLTGRVAHLLLHSLTEWVWAEYRALSRENELCADGDAGKQVGHDEMARALVLVEGCGARITELVMTPLEKELLGAIKPPVPPLQRMIGLLEDIRAPEQLAAAAAATMKSEQDPEARHPPFGKRLANLGFADVPSIGKVESSAIDRLLSPKAAGELITRLDDEWRKRVRDFVGVDR